MKTMKLAVLATLALSLTACGSGIGSKEDAAKALQRIMGAGNSVQSSAQKSGLSSGLRIDTTATVAGEEGTATATVSVNIDEGDLLNASMVISAAIVYKQFKAVGDPNTYDGSEKLDLTVKATTMSGTVDSKVVADMTMKGEFDSAFKCDVTVSVDAQQMSSRSGTASLVINGWIEADGTRYDYAQETIAISASEE